MKPLVSEGALKAVFITLGSVLATVAAVLIDVPGLPFPRWAIVLAGAIGGVLAGKEALPQSGTIKVSQLPLEWQPPEPEHKDPQ
jgi:uncharacterized membrane protein